MNPAFVEWAFDAHKKAWDESFKQWNRLINAPTVTEHAMEPKVASTPHDVVYEKDALKLYHYRRDTPAVVAEPMLICYALVNRPYILDLQPERSVVRRMLDGGMDVYLIDWGVPSAADKTLGLHDYICGSMRKVADVVRQRSETPNLNLLKLPRNILSSRFKLSIRGIKPDLLNIPHNIWLPSRPAPGVFCSKGHL